MRKPVCSTCNDTHLMDLMDLHDCTEDARRVTCTRCPTPCPKCRKGGTGPFCAKTPCSCGCHKSKVAWWACTVCKDLVVMHGALPCASVLTLNKHVEKCPGAKFVVKRVVV